MATDYDLVPQALPRSLDAAFLGIAFRLLGVIGSAPALAN
jgi:hypothetical protein